MDELNQERSAPLPPSGPPPQPPIQSPASVNPPLDEKYFKFAGFVVRFWALIVDSLIILTIAFFLALILPIPGRKNSIQDWQSSFDIIAGLLFLIYNMILIYVYGATLGKKLFGIKVVNKNYQKLSFLQALARETVGKFLSGFIFNLGYLWVSFDNKKQGWHDKIAKTYVVYDKPITYEEYIETQKNKPSKLPFVLIILGVLELIQPITVAVVVIPKLSKLYESFNVSGYNMTITYGLIGIIIVVALAQIIYGFLSLIKQKRLGVLEAGQKKLAKILLVIGVIAAVISIPIVILSIVYPIYNLTREIKPSTISYPTPTSTPDPTANLSRDEVLRDWKTYTNQKYRYTINYPSDWNILESSPMISIFPPEFNADKPNFLRSITIEVIDTNYAPLPPSSEKYTVPRTVNTGSQKIDILQSTNPSWRYKATIRKDNYQVSFYFGSSLDIKYSLVFDQILSTFKFLPETTPARSGYEVCAQVITPAKNPQTGECREFPTPCDVPQGWVAAESCNR